MNDIINPARVCIASIATPDMARLTKITWPNKEEYCMKWGYSGVLLTQTAPYLGFDKVHFLDGLIKTDKYDWILWLDNDTLITNFNTRVESLIDDNYHFIICQDYAQLNAGVFLIRNSPQGREYFNHLKTEMYRLAPNNPWLFGEEQYALVQTHTDERFRPFIKLISQKEMNAYPYSGVYGHPEGRVDLTGRNGDWQSGDFIIHIPGFGPDLFERRMQQFEKYKELVIK